MHDFPAYKNSFDFLVGGLVEQLQLHGTAVLACTMHGSFRSSLDLGITDVSWTVAIMAVRVSAMYCRSKKMRMFLIMCVIVASASRGAMDYLALSTTSSSICKSVCFRWHSFANESLFSLSRRIYTYQRRDLHSTKIHHSALPWWHSKYRHWTALFPPCYTSLCEAFTRDEESVSRLGIQWLPLHSF